MIDTELLEKTLAELYPEDMENYQEKRDIFTAGVQWGYNHPYFNKGCPERVWHYLTDDPTDLPDVNKICLIKFSDGTGSIGSMREITKDIQTQKVWVTQYRDDIIAWSYYVGGFSNNGTYI